MRRTASLFPIMLPVADLARALGVSRRELYAANKLGFLPIYRKGTRTRVLIEDAIRYVRTCWKKE